MIKETLVGYLHDSIKKNWDLPALSDFKGEVYSYGDIAIKIKRIHTLFDKGDLKKGDKVALIGKNSAHWGIAFIATVTYGAVIVPIMPEFKPKDAQNIINHSDARILFASGSILEKLDTAEMKAIEAFVILDDLSLNHSTKESVKEIHADVEKLYDERFPDGLSAESFDLPKIPNTELADINYTSGTTGFSKGVMLNHLSLASNLKFAQDNMPLKSGDDIVSFLPLAHAYGLAFEFLFPFSIGCHVHFLTKTPSPQIITQAFKEVRPSLILSVPLVIEKVFKKRIKPQIEKPLVATLLKIPLLNKLIFKKVLAGLNQGFGDNFAEVVIGGAALNEDIEKFFKKVGFKFTIGYGMTECGPLIAYAPWTEMRVGSCGRAVDRMEVMIDSDDPVNVAGEILVKGDNVMLGYYKNKEATDESIDKDGWLHTGDLGVIDKDGFIFIKGRSKNMILSGSGQNIFPEEIESILNTRAYVGESVVIGKAGKIYALVYPDFDHMKLTNVDESGLDKIYDKYRKQTNEHLPSYMQVSKIILYTKEFEKTPKQSIKRYLYQDYEV